MTNESADTKLKWLLQSDWRETCIPSLGREQWVTVYLNKATEDEDCGIFSALIPNAYVETYLSRISWDLTIGNGHPGCNKQGSKVTYLRFGNSEEIEPFVIHRRFDGIRDSYNEIIEEFRHFHRLYHDRDTNKLIKFDDRGDEIEVAKIEADKVEVKLKEVRQFLAIKEMHLAIYFDSKRFSELGPNDFPVKLYNKYNLTHYELSVNSQNFLPKDKYRFISRLLGKKLIAPLPLDRCGMWPFEENKEEDYIDFIIGLDENGDEVKYSCDPDGPNYLTPVFFRREVLTKYYADPERYLVEDGVLKCQELWGLRLDNNHDKYIVVFLGDLGRDLPSDERMYWRSYNIPPEGEMSKANFKRSFLAEFAEPEQIDLRFKQSYVRFSKNWEAVKGWKFFKELAEADQYLFETLHIPLTNSHQEFDSQVLVLTKVMIDSLNESKIVENIPGINTKKKEEKGISKLDRFLQAHQYQRHQQDIQFLRKLQNIRSKSAAHRKSSEEYPKMANTIGLKKSNRADVMKQLIVEATDFILSLESHFLQSSSDAPAT